MNITTPQYGIKYNISYKVPSEEKEKKINFNLHSNSVAKIQLHGLVHKYILNFKQIFQKFQETNPLP